MARRFELALSPGLAPVRSIHIVKSTMRFVRFG
jgi:hypothetical protein